MRFPRTSKTRVHRMFGPRPGIACRSFARPTTRQVVLLVVVSFALVGCGPGRSSSSGGAILFNVASSTTEAVERIRDNYENKTGHQVELDLGGTARLATQIKNGGDVDLFLSASEKWADEVTINQRGKSRVLRRVDLLSNRLVVVVPKDSTLSVSSMEDLLDPAFEHIALANPDALVPAGVYAKEALANLGLWETLLPKFVNGNNVRETLTYVEMRSVQAGIVYKTDAVASRDVRVAFEIDPSLHKQIRYPLLLLRHSARRPGASEFFEYLTGPEAAAVFTELGFSVLPVDKAPTKADEVTTEDRS